jgi:preprotein translocase subunit SecF
VRAALYALACILVYITFRFEWIYGVGAVIAVVHDTLVTIGLFSLFGEEMNLTVVAALLTLAAGIIIGTYSSVFVANPMLLFRHNRAGRRGRAAAPGLAPAVVRPLAAARKSKVLKP